MLMPAHSFVNTALILLNHVIRCPFCPENLEMGPKVRIFVLCFHSIRFKVNKRLAVWDR